MLNIEERVKAMNLQRVHKKIDELSSQKYEQDVTVPYIKKKLLLESEIPLTCMMKGKSTPLNISSPDTME